MNLKHPIRLAMAVIFISGGAGYLWAAGPATQPLKPAELSGIARDNARHFGDSPDDPGPLASDLSADLTQDAVLKAERKVADWELARAQPYFGEEWTWGALYVGFLAASNATGDPKYHDAMVAMGEKFQWRLGNMSNPTADDHCIGQAFLDLYFEKNDPMRIAATREELDRAISRPAPQGRPMPWWWCDALFMGPGAWSRMAKATGDAKYLDYMNRNWWACSDALYDTTEHLYFRDNSFKGKTEANGKKMFWSRGNGWVMGGLARTLPMIPADFPDRGKYIAQFKEMAARVVTLQDADGAWHAGLLDPDAYDLPENSGSAFFTYAMAWGMNEGLLDRATYQPAVARAWKGLLSRVYGDGRLGCIQQTGSGPAHYKPSTSYNYGVGAFLLAGSEIKRLVDTAEKK